MPVVIEPGPPEGTSFLSETDIASMRAVAAGSLPGVAVIQTQGYESDGGGGGTSIWSPSGTVDCRLAPYRPRAGEQVEGGRLSPDSEYLFTFPAETDIGLDSQIVYSGGTFSVTAIRRRSDELTRRVEAKEVV